MDIDGLRDWIDRTEEVTDVVSAAQAGKLAATIGLPQQSWDAGTAAPWLVHFCLALAPVATEELAADGHPPKGAFIPPVPLPRRMWAGSDIEFAAPLRIGDRIRRLSRITAINPKTGRSGSMCFVTIEHHIFRDDELLVRENQTLVYREAASPTQAATQREAAESENGLARTIRGFADTPLLFRYSALTFNSHRIHYDRDYAMQVEHYPGLVVQGPLQATLLLHHACKANPARKPRRFAFRGQSPLIEGAYALHEQSAEAGSRLWTTGPNGAVAMTADLVWE